MTARRNLINHGFQRSKLFPDIRYRNISMYLRYVEKPAAS